MARVAVSVAVFLSVLYLLTFSYARDIHDPFPESAKEIHREPETTRLNSEPKQNDTVYLSPNSTDPIPLTFVSFRPINRHVPRRPLPLPLSLRLGHRRCRNGHRREIPYGNDAIVWSAGGGGRGFDPANRGGVVRQIPTPWVRFRHAKPRFPEMMAQPSHPVHLIHSKHHEEEGEEGWFMKKIRMFLNLF